MNFVALRSSKTYETPVGPRRRSELIPLVDFHSFVLLPGPKCSQEVADTVDAFVVAGFCLGDIPPAGSCLPGQE